MNEARHSIGKLAETYAAASTEGLDNLSPVRKLKKRAVVTGRFLVTEGSEENVISYDAQRDVVGSMWGPSENPDWTAVAAPELTKLGVLTYKYGTAPLKSLRDFGARFLPRTEVEEAEALNYYKRREEIGGFNAEVQSGERQVIVYEANKE
jgi:hypothetical protein